MVQIIVTTSGGPKIEAAMSRRSGPRLYATTLKAAKAAGNVAKPIIQSQAPIGPTKATFRSVKVKNLRREVGVYVGPKVWYRHFVIGGTSRGIAPNPWVARGTALASRPAKAAFEAAMKMGVR